MYKITIKKLTREQSDERNWKQVGTDADGEAKYGYVKEEKTVDVEREVLEQIVDDLDMEKVIRAVNGIE